MAIEDEDVPRERNRGSGVGCLVIGLVVLVLLTIPFWNYIYLVASIVFGDWSFG